jgi:hypothetical protein
LFVLRDVWIRNQRAAVASKCATNLATHLPATVLIFFKSAIVHIKVDHKPTFFEPCESEKVPNCGTSYFFLSHCDVYVAQVGIFLVISSSVVDSGSGAFLTPGSGIGFFPIPDDKAKFFFSWRKFFSVPVQKNNLIL